MNIDELYKRQQIKAIERLEELVWDSVDKQDLVRRIAKGENLQAYCAEILGKTVIKPPDFEMHCWCAVVKPKPAWGWIDHVDYKWLQNDETVKQWWLYGGQRFNRGSKAYWCCIINDSQELIPDLMDCFEVLEERGIKPPFGEYVDE